MPWDLSQAILESLLGPRREPGTCWCPAVDVYQMSDGWILKLDLAGVSPTDIQVHVSGRQVNVRGRRRDWVVEESGACSAYSMEISYDQFERTVELPVSLDEVAIETRYREGMLLIRLRTGGQVP